MHIPKFPVMAGRQLAAQFGVVVRRLRLRVGLSQEQFADKCGLHRTYIGSIERGEKTVTIETAAKLAAALNLKLSALLSEVEAERDAADEHGRG